MKGDFSRRTFDPTRRFTGVHMQQGRVLLDADWNEQADLVRHRTESETRDLVGGCGGPLHAAAFGVLRYAGLPQAVRDEIQARHPGAFLDTKGDFVLTAGRYYVDGILCENEAPLPFAWQPDLPAETAGAGMRIEEPGFHLVYLDVWERHLTALDLPPIREGALGGPDTATRTRTVWQVRSEFLRERNGSGDAGPACEATPEYAAATAHPTGALRARARSEESAPNPCVLPPGGGYAGLENQLYRVEIHRGGAALEPAGPGADDVEVLEILDGFEGLNDVRDPRDHPGGIADAEEAARYLSALSDAGLRGLKLSALPAGWDEAEDGARRALELHLANTGATPMAGTLGFVVAVASDTADGRPVVILNATLPAVNLADQPRLRAVDATWKWSRDNGTVVARILSLRDREVTLEDAGPDEVLSFRPGDWVELTDDYRELHGIPGELAQVERRGGSSDTLFLRAAPAPLHAGGTGGVDPTRAPKLRRWDGVGAVRTGDEGDAFAALEDGVEVRFSAGTYRTGGYWMIPARTATGEGEGSIEWPQGPAGAGPLELPPQGIRHHYCRLAIVERLKGGSVVPVRDCRCLFAPVTAVNAIAYVSGAGQEAMPDLTDPAKKVPLGLPLVVGMANGHCREGERVRFTVEDGSGDLAAAPGAFGGHASRDVTVDADGLARCWWQLGGTAQHQRVRARLLEDGAEVHAPVLFNASLSVAHEVAYHPRDCGTLAGQKTVKHALDRVVDLVRIHRAGGEGQEAMPGATLPDRLRVLVTSTCGPVAGRAGAVEFAVVGGSGTLDGGAGPVVASTDADGFASVEWTLDGTTLYQEVEARLRPAAGPRAQPSAVRFGASLSVASNVAYDPGDCGTLAGRTTVQDAIDHAARLLRIHDAGGDGQWGRAGEALKVPLRVRVASTCGPVGEEKDLVEFRVVRGNGKFVEGDDPLVVDTDADGYATASWVLGDDEPYQQVEARLLAGDAAVAEPTTVTFGARLAVAADVAYDPGTCGLLSGAGNVQAALDRLAAVARLHPASATVQTLAHDVAPATLRVLAASACGPVAGRTVEFAVLSDEGTLSGGGTGSGSGRTVTRTTNPQGIASVNLAAPPGALVYEVEARLRGGDPAAEPSTVRFLVVRGRAEAVAYTPGDACRSMEGVKTVAQALDHLCTRPSGGGGGCSVTVGKGGTFETLKEALSSFEPGGALSLCLLEGEHELEDEVGVAGPGSVRITGRGPAATLRLRGGGLMFKEMDWVVLRDLAVVATESESAVAFDGCAAVTVEGCSIVKSGWASPAVRVAGGTRVRFSGSVLSSSASEWLTPSLRESLDRTKDLAGSPGGELEGLVARWAAALDADELRRAVAEEIGKLLEEPRRREAPPESRLEEIRSRLLVGAAAERLRRLAPERFHASIRHAASRMVYAEALTLVDPLADATVEDCRLQGYLGLYGYGQPMSPEHVDELGQQVAGSGIAGTPAGSLNVRGTVLVGMILDGEARHLAANSDRAGEPAPVYRHAALDSATLLYGGSALLGASVKVASSEFPENDLGLHALGGTVTAVGNAAPKAAGTLRLAAPSSPLVQHAANVLEVVVDAP